MRAEKIKLVTPESFFSHRPPRLSIKFSDTICIGVSLKNLNINRDKEGDAVFENIFSMKNSKHPLGNNIDSLN